LTASAHPIRVTARPEDWPATSTTTESVAAEGEGNKANSATASTTTATKAAEKPKSSGRRKKPDAPEVLDCFRTVLRECSEAKKEIKKKELVDVAMERFSQDHASLPRPSRSAWERILSQLADYNGKTWKLKETVPEQKPDILKLIGSENQPVKEKMDKIEPQLQLPVEPLEQQQQQQEPVE
jgi:hypothetical protein